MPKATSGLTKTDFMRGMQCKRMLWLDQHHPKLKVIPPHIRQKLNQGNAFGDAAMGIFGPYTEVREYFPRTTCPNKKAMVRKTQELIGLRTPVICEAAFMDEDGNYCAVDLLRRNAAGNGWELYEVKNSPAVDEQHIKDAAYQVYLIKDVIGLPITKASIIHNSGDEADPLFSVSKLLKPRSSSLAHKSKPSLFAFRLRDHAANGREMVHFCDLGGIRTHGLLLRSRQHVLNSVCFGVLKVLDIARFFTAPFASECACFPRFD